MRRMTSSSAVPSLVASHGRRGRSAAPGFLAAATLLAFSVAACGGDSDAADEPGDEPWAGDEWAGEDRGGEAPSAPVAAIPSGTVLTFEVHEDVSTATHEAGERFSLRLVSGVEGARGAAIPAGAMAQGVVTESHRSTGADAEAVLGVRIASVQVNGAYKDIQGTVQSTDLETAARDSGQRSAAKVATGAAAGAIIGQIIGRDTRSTVTGAAVGAAAGLGIALTTRDGHAVLPRGATVVVRLDEPLVVN
jgi:hypothetical protein